LLENNGFAVVFVKNHMTKRGDYMESGKKANLKVTA